tara:strand:- start:235 stop:459 length:225 start_codon:yes stop_codon:yes gene_type:complete
MKFVTFAITVGICMTLAVSFVPLLRDDPVNVVRIPNGWLVDGACYQVVINLDEPIDEDLLESYIRGALSNYITE